MDEAAVMAVTVVRERFIRFPAGSAARRAEGVTEKCPMAGNYGRLSQLYTPKMSGVPPEIYTYAERPTGQTRTYIYMYIAAAAAVAIVPHRRDSVRSFYLFTHNQRAANADPNEKRRHRAAGGLYPIPSLSRLSIIFAMPRTYTAAASLRPPILWSRRNSCAQRREVSSFTSANINKRFRAVTNCQRVRDIIQTKTPANPLPPQKVSR